jgi:hypothetical protein
MHRKRFATVSDTISSNGPMTPTRSLKEIGNERLGDAMIHICLRCFRTKNACELKQIRKKSKEDKTSNNINLNLNVK